MRTEGDSGCNQAVFLRADGSAAEMPSSSGEVVSIGIDSTGDVIFYTHCCPTLLAAYAATMGGIISPPAFG